MHDEMWHKGKGVGMLVLGLLVVANAYFVVVDWETFIGALLILGGLMKLIMSGKKKKRR